MIRRYIGSGMLAALSSLVGVLAIVKSEKRLAGGKAISASTLIARSTLRAAAMRQMKIHRSKNG